MLIIHVGCLACAKSWYQFPTDSCPCVDTWYKDGRGWLSKISTPRAGRNRMGIVGRSFWRIQGTLRLLSLWLLYMWMESLPGSSFLILLSPHKIGSWWEAWSLSQFVIHQQVCSHWLEWLRYSGAKFGLDCLGLAHRSQWTTPEWTECTHSTSAFFWLTNQNTLCNIKTKYLTAVLSSTNIVAEHRSANVHTHKHMHTQYHSPSPLQDRPLAYLEAPIFVPSYCTSNVQPLSYACGPSCPLDPFP